MRLQCSLVIAAALAASALAGPPPSLPVVVPKARWRPLDDSVHPGLQAALSAGLRADPARRAMLEARTLAVGLVDLTVPSRPRYARANGDTMLYAASLPKIALLLGAYAALDAGRIQDSPALRADLSSMIRVSSNAAATRVLDRIGMDYLRQVLTRDSLRLYDKTRGGGLWVGKRFAKAGPRIGDPLKNISHAATARQVCRFYYLLATGQLLSPARSKAMLDHLARPGLHHGFVGAIEARAPKAELYRKSGTWSKWRADSVLVWGPKWRRYILCALVEGGEGRKVLREVVDVAEQALKATASHQATPAPKPASP